MPARRCGLGRLGAGGVLKLFELVDRFVAGASARGSSRVASICASGVWMSMVRYDIRLIRHGFFTSYLLSVLVGGLRGTEDLVPNIGDFLRVSVLETLPIGALSHGWSTWLGIAQISIHIGRNDGSYQSWS